MDKPRNPGQTGAFGKRPHPVHVRGHEPVAGAFLQGSGAVHHRLHAPQHGLPFGRRLVCEVDLDPTDPRKASSGRRDPPARADDLMAKHDEASDDIAADQPIAADDEDANGAP